MNSKQELLNNFKTLMHSWFPLTTEVSSWLGDKANVTDLATKADKNHIHPVCLFDDDAVTDRNHEYEPGTNVSVTHDSTNKLYTLKSSTTQSNTYGGAILRNTSFKTLEGIKLSVDFKYTDSYSRPIIGLFSGTKSLWAHMGSATSHRIYTSNYSNQKLSTINQESANTISSLTSGTWYRLTYEIENNVLTCKLYKVSDNTLLSTLTYNNVSTYLTGETASIVLGCYLAGTSYEMTYKDFFVSQKREVLDQPQVNVELSASSYNVTIDNDVTLTCKVTDNFGNPVPNFYVPIKKDDVAWSGGTTGNDGTFSLTYNCNTWGIITFSASNSNVQVRVTGWREDSQTSYDVNYKEDMVEFKLHYEQNLTATTSWKEFGTVFGSITKPSVNVQFMEQFGAIIIRVKTDGSVQYRSITGSNVSASSLVAYATWRR